MAKRASKKKPTDASKSTARDSSAPKLLSSGNPQIPKGDGDGPVQAYIAAMPGWKHAIGRRLDELITGAVPKVEKAVRWNTPLYGLEGRGFFLGFYCYAKYVQLTFFRGTSLEPLPPRESKVPEVRYFHIHEHDALDEAQLTSWIRQAARLPGWTP
jgi:hypothetical protein